MKRQRGSILVGVIGLSAIVTVALAGFLTMAGSSNRLQADSESEIQLHYAAESAMDMGLRWLRTYPSTKTGNPAWPASPVYLNSILGDFTDLEGCKVRVRFSATPGEFEPHKITCFATFGGGRDTLEINYYLATTVDNQEVENGTTLSGLTMSQWREIIHPGH